MKKWRKIIFLIILGLSLASCWRKVTEEEAREVLKTHLENRYGEPFEVGRMGLHSVNNKVYFQGEIIPSRYRGTPKMRDDYYSSYGTVRVYKNIFGERLGTGGDVYMGVNLNENAAEFFKEKLDELFDELYIPVFDIDVWRVLGNGNFEETLDYHRENELPFPIKGGIYIFGRVESDEDREEYRRKIFEFIEFMKETNTFKHAGFWMVMQDKRVLSDDFVSNEEDQRLLLNISNHEREENIIKRATIMDKYTGSFEATSKEDKLIRIDNYGKNQGTLDRKTFYNVLLVAPIFTPEYERANFSLDFKERKYDVYEDIEFTEKYYYDKEKMEVRIKK